MASRVRFSAAWSCIVSQTLADFFSLLTADGLFFSKNGFGQEGNAYYGELPLSFGEQH